MSELPFTLKSFVPALMVRDVDAMVAFYCDLLGFEVAFVNEGVYAVLRRGDVELHIGCDLDYSPGGHGSAYLFVENVDALYERATTRAKIVHAIKDQSYGLRDFLMEDPEGNRIGMAQRR